MVFPPRVLRTAGQFLLMERFTLSTSSRMRCGRMDSRSLQLMSTFTLNEWVKFNPPYYTALSGAIATANATGTYTVVVTLKHADPGFLLDLADLGMIVPQHIWASVATPNNFTNMVGDGPFSFVSRTPGVDIILKANPTYWLGPPHYGYLVIKIFTSVDASDSCSSIGKRESL